MKTHAFLARLLVALVTACGGTEVDSLTDASVADASAADANIVADASVADAVTDASAADANIADTSSPDASTVPRISASAGFNHTCAILGDHSVKCWGYNGNGELGLGDTNHRGDAANEMGDHLPKVDLGTGRTVKEVSAAPGTRARYSTTTA